ncbi:MAG TPA: hypothetical protein EYP20_06240 [Aigarchaeota archaeon]|nr:hypothetical protein [Aigarchaeota archaeon]
MQGEGRRGMLLYLALALLAAAWLAAYLVLRLASRRTGKKPENITIYPLFLMLRTKRVVEPLDKIANLNPRLWDVVARIAIVTGFGMAAFAVYILVNNLSTYLFRPETVGVQNIVIPLIIGVTIRLEHIPYLLLAFGIVLITHEGMHGIIARREGIPLKSAGIFLLFILPGGFVEPEEKAFREAEPGKRIRVAAVGSFANLVVGVFVIFLMLGLFLPSEGGLYIVETSEDARIPANEVIVSIDGAPVNRFTLTRSITLGEKMVVKGLRSEYVFEIREQFVGREVPIGVLVSSLGAKQVDYFYPLRIGSLDPSAVYTLYKTLNWIQLVSLGVAVFNMLPIYMLDGSIMLASLLEKITKDQRKIRITLSTVAVLCVTLLLANIMFTYSTFGFFQL